MKRAVVFVIVGLGLFNVLPSLADTAVPTVSNVCEPVPSASPIPTLVSSPEPTPLPSPVQTSDPVIVVPVEPSPTPTVEPTPVSSPEPSPSGSVPAIEPSATPLPVITPTPISEPSTSPTPIDTKKDNGKHLGEISAEHLAVLAQLDDPQLPTELANIPVIGEVSKVVLEFFNQVGNVGADMQPSVRATAKKEVIAAVIVGQLSLSAVKVKK